MGCSTLAEDGLGSPGSPVILKFILSKAFDWHRLPQPHLYLADLEFHSATPSFHAAPWDKADGHFQRPQVFS